MLGGLAVGAASVMAPAYISEIAPASYRGMLTTIQQVAIISGLFVAFVSNYSLANLAGASTEKFWLDYEAWRWMFWIEIGPATIFFVMLLFIPESPRFLVVRGHNDSARNVLTKLYGSAEAEQKLLEIKHSLSDCFDRPNLSDLRNPSGTVRSIVRI